MSNDDRDYSRHPKSVSELRAERDQLADRWSPRDALICALRELDAGELRAGAILIVASHCDAEGRHMKTRFYSAVGDAVQAFGLLDLAARHMWETRG